MGMGDAAKRVRVQLLVASLVTAATLAPMSGAGAAAGTGPVVASSGFTAVGELGGVAAVSARNAWAVTAAKTKTLVLHWNGSSWK